MCLQVTQLSSLSLSYPLFIPYAESLRNAIGVLKDHLTIEVDIPPRLLPIMPEPKQPRSEYHTTSRGAEALQDVVDAPLVPIYNFLCKSYSPQPLESQWLT